MQETFRPTPLDAKWRKNTEGADPNRHRDFRGPIEARGRVPPEGPGRPSPQAVCFHQRGKARGRSVGSGRRGEPE